MHKIVVKCHKNYWRNHIDEVLSELYSVSIFFKVGITLGRSRPYSGLSGLDSNPSRRIGKNSRFGELSWMQPLLLWLRVYLMQPGKGIYKHSWLQPPSCSLRTSQFRSLWRGQFSGIFHHFYEKFNNLLYSVFKSVHFLKQWTNVFRVPARHLHTIQVTV